MGDCNGFIMIQIPIPRRGSISITADESGFVVSKALDSADDSENRRQKAKEVFFDVRRPWYPYIT